MSTTQKKKKMENGGKNGDKQSRKEKGPQFNQRGKKLLPTIQEG